MNILLIVYRSMGLNVLFPSNVSTAICGALAVIAMVRCAYTR